MLRAVTNTAEALVEAELSVSRCGLPRYVHHLVQNTAKEASLLELVLGWRWAFCASAVGNSPGTIRAGELNGIER